MSSSFDNMFFGVFPIIFMVVFCLIFGIILFIFILGLIQANKNKHSPVLVVEASVVGKRADVSHSHRDSGSSNMYTSNINDYYVTFQVESGDRLELCVPDSEYGMLAEDDNGKLTFQGTQFKSFERM